MTTDRLYAARWGHRWVWWTLRRGGIMAALRHAWSIYVRGWDGETCQRCGRRYAFWRADDQLYGRVTGYWPSPDGEAGGGLFCHDCFEALADERGILVIWTPRIYDEWRAEYDAALKEQPREPGEEG